MNDYKSKEGRMRKLSRGWTITFLALGAVLIFSVATVLLIPTLMSETTIRQHENEIYIGEGISVEATEDTNPNDDLGTSKPPFATAATSSAFPPSIFSLEEDVFTATSTFEPDDANTSPAVTLSEPNQDCPHVEYLTQTNVRDTTFTVVWTTDMPTSSSIRYWDDQGKKKVVQDVRGERYTGLTYYVEVIGLSPNTTYNYEITMMDCNEDNAGDYFNIQTGPTLPLPHSDTIYGQVFLGAKRTPATGAVVLLTLQDADGQGSPASASILSSLVDENGYWYSNLGNARWKDLRAYFEYSPANDTVNIQILTGNGHVVDINIKTSIDSPTEPILLQPE